MLYYTYYTQLYYDHDYTSINCAGLLISCTLTAISKHCQMCIQYWDVELHHTSNTRFVFSVAKVQKIPAAASSTMLFVFMLFLIIFLYFLLSYRVQGQHSTLIEWTLCCRHHMEPIPVTEHMKTFTDHWDWVNYYWCVTKVRRCLEVTAVRMGRSLQYHQPQENMGGRRGELQEGKLGRKMRRWLAAHTTSLPQPITALVVPWDPPQLQLRGICLIGCALTVLHPRLLIYLKTSFKMQRSISEQWVCIW